MFGREVKIYTGAGASPEVAQLAAAIEGLRADLKRYSRETNGWILSATGWLERNDARYCAIEKSVDRMQRRLGPPAPAQSRKPKIRVVSDQTA